MRSILAIDRNGESNRAIMPTDRPSVDETFTTGCFAIWERRGGGGRTVTFPARQYSVNGERRSFALLRPVTEPTAQEGERDRILEAYAAFAQAEAV